MQSDTGKSLGGALRAAMGVEERSRLEAVIDGMSELTIAELERLSSAVAREHRRRADEWEKLRRQVYRRDNYQCQYCGAKGVAVHADHKLPKSRGGSNDIDNLVTACGRCNASKGNLTVEEWLRSGRTGAATFVQACVQRSDWGTFAVGDLVETPMMGIGSIIEVRQLPNGHVGIHVMSERKRLFYFSSYDTGFPEKAHHAQQAIDWPPQPAARTTMYPIWPKGTRVTHPVFGLGTVVQNLASRGDLEITIDFDERGQKRLMASLARLEVAP